ncbi:hypothetical protein BDV12DRAFT_204668 [Aspergillus spectabilis]
MDLSQNRFLVVMSVPECAEIVLAVLNRSQLKSVRLVCTMLDELVASAASHLFSRVYISAYQDDLDVLAAIAIHPRLARCVRELVWDTSMKPDRYANRIISQCYETKSNLAICDQIIADYDRVTEQAVDFQVLLKALPQFPRLHSVVVSELMSHWIPRAQRRRMGKPFPNLDTELSSESSLAPYSSPAMRRWQNFGVYHIWGTVEIDRPNKDVPDEGVLMRLDEWARAGGEVSENSPEAKIIMALVSCSHRIPIMLLTALRETEIRLKSFVIDPPIRHHRQCPVSGNQFSGLDFRLLRPWAATVARFTDMFRSLRRLRLCLSDNSFPGGLDIRHVLERAESLETLELSSFERSEINLSFVLPCTLQLREFVLTGFCIGKTTFEEVVLPWAFARRLKMLQLTSCVFLCSPGVDELQLFQWIVNKDVSCTGDGSDTTFPAGDSTSLCECVLMDCSTDDTDSDEDTEEHHMIQFMDIDFESDLENDPDYFPCTPEMYCCACALMAYLGGS